VAAAAPTTDAEPAPVQTAAAAQAAAPEVVSVTGKVAKTVEPKTTASTTATAVAAAVADAAAEPVHGQVAATAHAATTGEGSMGEGAQDQASAQGSALKDAAPIAVAADSTATAPTFVAPGTTAAPAPIVAAQLPKAGPETVSHLTTEIASKAVVGKTSRFDVVLQPEGLGRVDVRIEIAKDGKLTAALNFDNPAAAAELRGKSGELRQALAAAGFNVADSALSFDSSSQNQNGGQKPERLLQQLPGRRERPSGFPRPRLPIGAGRGNPHPVSVRPAARPSRRRQQRRRRQNLGETAMVAATSSTGNATTDKINNSRNSLANNEQTFLKLLTTQLKNQDPLSPTDTTQMTSQITQMTGVEQQLVTNDLLAALVGMSTGGGISEGVNLMGKQVTAETDKSVLKNKEASWSYTQSRSATGVKIEVLDKFGKRHRHRPARRHVGRRPHLQVGRQERRKASSSPKAASTPSR
jgi:flagellar hook assembly protein FlgD